MNLLFLSWKNLRERPLHTLMSVMLLTLGVSIISLLLILSQQLDGQFKDNIKGIDMVVGAKGSPTQLILSSVYHIDNPTGNIPLKEAEELLKHPLVKEGIMMAYGDSYKGYRILGTDHSYVEHYEGKLAEGKLWEEPFEATVGATAAERLNLQLGDTFYGSHGNVETEEGIHMEESYKVVGILAPSGRVIDQLIMTPIQSVWSIHEDHGEEEAHDEVDHAQEENDHGAADHDHEEGQAHDHEEGKEITAMLVKWKSAMGMMMLPRMVDKETSMKAALPAIEVSRLTALFSVGRTTIEMIALAIILISGISVFVSIYSSLKDRKYELALMRTMGASREQLLILVLLEGVILGALGYICGILVSRIGVSVLSFYFEDAYHYALTQMIVSIDELWLLLAIMVIGGLAALIPGIRAFSLNISQTLADG
ncbi:MAG: ABC transporter permease [Bacteroidota bacterium]